jgi:DUF1680 family protein
MTVSTICLGILALFATNAMAVSTTAPKQPAERYPLTSVRLLDGYFKDAATANRAYLLALEPDRLLAPFLREAGLTPKAKVYGNWESSGLDGHTGRTLSFRPVRHDRRRT